MDISDFMKTPAPDDITVQDFLGLCMLADFGKTLQKHGLVIHVLELPSGRAYDLTKSMAELRKDVNELKAGLAISGGDDNGGGGYKAPVKPKELV